MPNENPQITFEKVFTVFVLFLSTGAFLNLAVDRNSDLEAGLVWMQVTWLLIYCVLLYLLVKRKLGILQVLRREILLLALVLFACISVVWSDDPSLTARRAVALVLTTLFGVYFAVRYSRIQQLRLLACTFSLAAMGSILFEAFGLGTAVDVGVAGWIGIYVQKNQLGIIMAFATAVFLILRKADTVYRAWATAGALVTVTLLILSRSMTALVMFLCVISMFPLSGFLRKSYRTIFVFGMLVVPASMYTVSWSVDNLDRVAEFLGRDPTLTGRVQLWILCTVMALQRTWLGYGYNAFWRGGEGASAAVWELLPWGPPHSHNGFLEVWLGLGLVGLVLFTLGFLAYSKRSIVFLRTVRGPERVWPLMFLVLMFLSNLTGTSILSRNTIFWIMYVAVGLTSFRSNVSSAESGEPLMLRQSA